MSYQSSDFSPKIQQKTRDIAEQFYGTETHPDHIPINADSAAKLDSISTIWFNCALDEKGEPISWVVLIPTSHDLMQAFVSGTITERQLFDATATETPQEALYLCSALTIPAYRRKGLAMKLMLEAVETFEATGPKELFAWPYSPEGEQMIKTMSERLKRKIYIRESTND